MYTFVSNSGLVVVSPNTRVPPPKELARPAKDSDILTQGHKIRMFEPNYPHLPFFRRPIRHGPLFSPLNYTRDTIPIVYDRHRWKIRDDVRKQWTELDGFLSAVLHTIMQAIGMIPLAVDLGPFPSSVPYAQEHLSERAARGCASKALRSFQHLFTTCSWAMAYFPPLDEPETGWTRILLKAGFSPSMVQMLRDSPIGQFSSDSPRLGTVVNISNEHSIYQVERLVRAHVPVWILWGVCDIHGQRRFHPVPHGPGARYVNAKCYPSDQDLVEACRKVRGLPSNTQSQLSLIIPSDAHPDSLDTIKFPKVHHGSGQRPGETWQNFFQRQDKRHEELTRTETPEERKGREARAAKKTIPGAHGRTKVFIWDSEEVDGGSFRVRVPYNRFDGVRLMNNYSESQKRYNAFDNEWDVCTEFDPEGVVPPDPFEHFDEDLGGPTTDSPPAAVPSVNASSFQPGVFVGTEFPAPLPSHHLPLDEILYERYGFLYPLEPVNNLSTGSLEQETKQVAKYVCEGGAVPPSSTSALCAIHLFLHQLSRGESVSSGLRDLQDCSFVELYANGPIIVEERRGQYHSLDESTSVNKYYLLRPRSLNVEQRFTIFLQDPVAVLNVIRRQWGPHLSDVAAELVSAGIPFSTRVVYPDIPRPAIARTTALGFLPFHYQLHTSDYFVYLNRRDSLLQRRYGRAALAKGGILGRLAREALGDDIKLLIQNGPSSEVLQYGTAIRIGQLYYWDDELTEDEEQIICGVYKFSTGEFIITPPSLLIADLDRCV